MKNHFNDHESIKEAEEQKIHISFERDPGGLVLPTLRNKEVVEGLIKTYGSKSKIPQLLENDVYAVINYGVLWNSEGGSDWYSTPKIAMRMQKAKVLTAELNIKYLHEKSERNKIG